MIERHAGIGETAVFAVYLCLIQALIRAHARQPRHRIRLPVVQRIHLVLVPVHFSQILNTVIPLIPVDMVYLTFR